jgi:hypothetical protein
VFRLEEEVQGWTRRLTRDAGLAPDDAEELTSHLWDLIDGALYAGVRPEEAFARARSSMGTEAELGAEFSILYEEEYMDFEKEITESRENPAALETLYRQKPQAFTASLSRVLERFPDSAVLSTWKARLSYAPFLADRKKELGELLTLIGLCLLSAVTSKLPALWGVDVWKTMPAGPAAYLLNASFFFMPMIAAFYIMRQRPRTLLIIVAAAVFLAAFVGINLMPAQAPWQTRVLSVLHLPFLLWIVVGLAFAGNDWRSLPVRVDFLRFTGELFIYTVLILLGGGVLTAFTLSIFSLIGMNIQHDYVAWIGVIGLFAAPVVAAWLTEKRRGLADNFAPVLSYIFTPLFLVTLVVFLVFMALTGKSPYTDRDSLLMFNVMLILVIALVVFNVTERKLTATARVYDPLNAGLILVALVIDAIALSAIIERLGTSGPSPNRVALLGENLVLLVNIVGLAVQYIRTFAGKARFSAVENWTVRCLPLYAVWLAVVAFLFPALFGYA